MYSKEWFRNALAFEEKLKREGRYLCVSPEAFDEALKNTLFTDRNLALKH